MPVNKITPTKRGAAAVAAALVAAGVSGWAAFIGTGPDKPATAAPTQTVVVTPAKIRTALDMGITPPAVDLAINRLIKPWEGLVLTSHWDPFAKVWDICYGERFINGQLVKPGMSFTRQQCEDMLRRRVVRDYYLPLVDKVKGYANAPVSLQASMLSGAYNFGAPAAIGSTAARRLTAGRYRDACEAQTAFNKSRGKVVGGLVTRREMGDEQRLGEAELCVSGLG